MTKTLLGSTMDVFQWLNGSVNQPCKQPGFDFQ